jgi:3-hydroxybutyryl-CoA dehydrogenase
MLFTMKKIVVCGAGTMGSGIAQMAVQAGYQAVLYDVHENSLKKGRENIQKNLQYAVDKGKMTSEKLSELLNSIHFTNKLEECKGDLVIEAIVENLEIKKNLFATLSDVNSEHTIYTSNTSSLAINDIAGVLANKHRMAGLHFFNPAHLMRLVEIVKTKCTTDDVVEQLKTVVVNMGKTAVVCNDSPGFIVNRIARPYYLEALRMLEKGLVQDPAEIDLAMEAAGFKMGPFRLMDLIGMDVNYAVSEIVWKALQEPERLKPSPIQKEKVANGHLGRKTGQGFYGY